MGENKLTRSCHIIKRDDFDGYGFNLHAEKGKPGQYIGKVDDNSPAESAGLKQGDRIIEVNGVNIGNETHKQVVQRIKAIADEVRLLVVDPTIVSVSNNNQVIDGNSVTANNVSNEMAATMTTDVTTAATDATATTPTTMQTSSASDHENANDVHDAPTAAATVAAETAESPVAAVKAATNGQNGQSPNSNQTNDSHAHSLSTNTSSMTTATGNWQILLLLILQIRFLTYNSVGERKQANKNKACDETFS